MTANIGQAVCIAHVQKRNGLVVDSIIGNQTALALLGRPDLARKYRGSQILLGRFVPRERIEETRT
jgi:hypothetical protein